MTARGLSVKLKSDRLQLSGDFAVTETCKTATSAGHHDCVIAPRGDGRKRDWSLALTASFDDLPGHIAGDVQSFGIRAPLCHQARQFIGRCQVQPFR
jgi:hypothetical protein